MSVVIVDVLMFRSTDLHFIFAALIFELANFCQYKVKRVRTRLCVVVALTELYQFTPLIVTLVTFQGHNSTSHPDVTVMVDWA